MRIPPFLILFSFQCLLSEAWISKSSVVPRNRLYTTELKGKSPKFAQGNTNKKVRNVGGDAALAIKHEQRIRTAGRVGTKRFVDPCKVFIGNLPFTTNADELSRFVLDTMGQSRLVLHSAKVIHDWKTGKSKGFGFVVFTDPIFATVCMEVVNGKKMNGRVVTVSQKKKKDQDNQLYLNKKRKSAQTDEEAAIASALDEAESDEEFFVDDDDKEIPIFGGGSDEDLELDAVLFGISGDDEDDAEYDGIFLERNPIYEEMDPNLNREQRREAARRLKRTKLPHKGFG